MRGRGAMFGYICVYRPQLRICEWEAYQAVYCGFCRELGRRFGPFVRLTLSYDFTFLAMVGMALDGQKPEIREKRCPADPLHRRPVCVSNGRLAEAADIAALALWLKLSDDLRDGGFLRRLGARFLRPIFRRPYRKAAAARPELSDLFERELTRQREIEARRSDSPDEASDPTAVMTAAVFESLSGEESARRTLRRFGYLLGRYIYLADALDDWEEDRRNGAYNPFLAKGLQGGKDEALASLRLTIGEIGPTYDLLPLRRFQPIFENIIGPGLRSTADALLIPKNQRRKNHA